MKPRGTGQWALAWRRTWKIRAEMGGRRRGRRDGGVGQEEVLGTAVKHRIPGSASECEGGERGRGSVGRPQGGEGAPQSSPTLNQDQDPRARFPPNHPFCQVLVETQKQSYGPFSPFKNHRYPTRATRAKFLGDTEALWALRLTSIGASLLCLRL